MKQNTFFIVFSSKIDVEEMSKYLVTLPGHGKWFYNLPNSIFVNTELTAEEISEYIEKKFGEMRHFIVKCTDTEHWGRLPEEHWKLFKSKSN